MPSGREKLTWVLPEKKKIDKKPKLVRSATRDFSTVHINQKKNNITHPSYMALPYLISWGVSTATRYRSPKIQAKKKVLPTLENKLNKFTVYRLCLRGVCVSEAGS